MSEQGAAPAGGFPTIRFRFPLRPSQRDVVAIVDEQLREGGKRFHIVAPPGSGKTVVGLYLWAERIRTPAVVLSPNSAIQAQWAARTDLFQFDVDPTEAISTDPQAPSLLTSLTYQSVTLPRTGDEDLDRQAIVAWQDKLVESGQAADPVEAQVWINDLRQRNPDYYRERLSAYRKQVRDALASGGDALAALHRSARETLERLRQQGVGLVILDECHHLMGHWGRVLADAHDLLDGPIVLGLTATPPDRDNKLPDDVVRYDELFGPIDFDVPVPAVVKDGFLAPYQDLAFFTRPTAEELRFVAGADRLLHELVDQLCQQRTDQDDTSRCSQGLIEWLNHILTTFELPTGKLADWKSFAKRTGEFADAARLFLLRRGEVLPPDVPPPTIDLRPQDVPEMLVVVPVLDRFIRYRLRRSNDPADRALAEQAIDRLRTLGVQITETGSRACASPVGRVMAYSQSKAAALRPILTAEMAALGDRIRAVVIADYEKTSAVTAEVSHLLDDEAGGAIAAFKTLLADEQTDRLDPILVTGSSVLVDDDLLERFSQAAGQWLEERSVDVELQFGEHDGFHVVSGQGGQWCPRVYVELITELFQQGVTRCLVGTRGLLGEGWDASKTNVLVDLTTVTTSMTVNQLRGRSIRLDRDDPEKLADNWDVVCIAPELSKGLDDYARFMAKHKTIFGVTDDGAIEKGVGHVHAAFTEMKPEGLEQSVAALNTEMLSRVARRPQMRALWRIGEPYRSAPTQTLEVRPGGGGGFPPFGGSKTEWNDATLAAAIGQAVLGALSHEGHVTAGGALQVSERDGGYVRVFLEQASEHDSGVFVEALHEAMGPLDRPRYVIPRMIDHQHETWLSKLLPEVVGRFFRRRSRELIMLHAVPSRLARNKETVAVYQRWWNRLVSPGQAVYAHHERGQHLLEQARRNRHLPGSEIHEKNVFL